MNSHSYAAFVVLAAVVVLAPGPDFAVTVENALVGGRRRGAWTGVGITASNLVQGFAAAFGLGALVLRSQPVFETIRWAGVGYLIYLGVQALRAARRGLPADDASPVANASAWHGFRQGFLSNITNPKVLVFYLAALPQFLTPHSPIWRLLALAGTHALLSLGWLLAVVLVLHRLRALLTRRRVQRVLHAVTGVALLGFGARLATER